MRRLLQGLRGQEMELLGRLHDPELCLLVASPTVVTSHGTFQTNIVPHTTVRSCPLAVVPNVSRIVVARGLFFSITFL